MINPRLGTKIYTELRLFCAFSTVLHSLCVGCTTASLPDSTLPVITELSSCTTTGGTGMPSSLCITITPIQDITSTSGYPAHLIISINFESTPATLFTAAPSIVLTSAQSGQSMTCKVDSLITTVNHSNSPNTQQLNNQQTLVCTPWTTVPIELTSAGSYNLLLTDNDNNQAYSQNFTVINDSPNPVSASLIVTADPSSTPPITLNTDFVGFSYDKDRLMSGLFNSNNSNLINLYSKWGPGILRIGGSTVNMNLWAPSGPGLTPRRTAPADVDSLNGFLGNTKWNVIYGVNGTPTQPLTTQSIYTVYSPPSLSNEEATYVFNHLGSHLLNFEIGNEPDLYFGNGLRPTTYTYADFLLDWMSYYSVIKASNPGAHFAGPASAYLTSTGYTVPFPSPSPSGVGTKINLLTQHYYFGSGRPPSPKPVPSITSLLIPGVFDTLQQKLPLIQKAAESVSNGYRMAETNSFSGGGAPGVSDGFGTALWLVEYCFTLAQYGASGANFHGGGNAPYTPIEDDGNGNVLDVRAEYYGMLLFSLMTPGTILNIESQQTPSSLLSYAVQKTGGIAVAILNNSSTQGVTTTVTFPSTVTSANAMLLTAPSLGATSGFTFGESAIGYNGDWSPVPIPFEVRNGTITPYVPAGSAILILTNGLSFTP